MKKSKTFRLSEEVCEILDKADNATALIEDLVLNGSHIQKDPPWKDLEYRIDQLDGTAQKTLNRLKDFSDRWLNLNLGGKNDSI